MSVIFIALPIAILLAGSAVIAFIWAVKGGQFDDLDSPAVRVAVERDEDGLDPSTTRSPDQS